MRKDQFEINKIQQRLENSISFLNSCWCAEYHSAEQVEALMVMNGCHVTNVRENCQSLSSGPSDWSTLKYLVTSLRPNQSSNSYKLTKHWTRLLITAQTSVLNTFQPFHYIYKSFVSHTFKTASIFRARPHVPFLISVHLLTFF